MPLETLSPYSRSVVLSGVPAIVVDEPTSKSFCNPALMLPAMLPKLLHLAQKPPLNLLTWIGRKRELMLFPAPDMSKTKGCL